MALDLFPMRFIAPIIAALERGITGHTVVARSLGRGEAADTIGVFPATWQPTPNSMELGQYEPTLSIYLVRVQNLRIDADEIAGRAAFNNTSRKIRAILYRDTELRLALGELTEEIVGTTERVKKFDVTKQDYLSARADDNSGMMYLCTTDVVVQTETVRNGI